jgi:hypothetical protein
MPATFLLRALIVDPLRNGLPDVPVRPFAYDLSKNEWAPIGEVGFTDGQGVVEIDISGSPAVTSTFLGVIALRHEETDVVLAEQWWSYASGTPAILDYGEVRVWDPPLTALSERSIAGVPGPVAEALGDADTVADLEAQLATAQGELASAQAQLTSTQGQLAASQVQLADLQGAHDATLGQLADAQGSLGQLQTAHDATLEELAIVNAELAALQASGGGATSTLESMVANVGQQLTATQTALVASGSPFQLGKLSLSLKVVPSSGTSFGLPTMDELASIGGKALSTLHLDFAQTTPAAASPPPDATVPALQGLTEPAARRQLAALGLGASVVHQAIADDGDVALAGRVLKQIPAAGAEIQLGQMVTLVLGKALASAS